MGIMVWSPLASGLLSGKYRPGEEGGKGEGRLEATKDINNPAFQKFSPQNWQIVAELEIVAKEMGRSMAQVAVNWAANQPGIASVIIGATKLHQLQDNLQALDFTIPEELLMRLNQASIPTPIFPYSFFGSEIQAMIHGGSTVGAKPESYYPTVEIKASSNDGESMEESADNSSS